MKLGFIGAGNMARAMILGLVKSDFSAHNIWASNPQHDILQNLKDQLHIHVDGDNKKIVEACEVIVLSIKPQAFAEVCQEIKPLILEKKPLIISVAAGIPVQRIEQWLSPEIPIVRTMPNAASLAEAGMTGLFANSATNALQLQIAESIMRAVGSVLWVENEALLDQITALSGSGPAYFLLFMECLQQAGEAIGLSHADSQLLTLQTAFGSAKLALESGEDFLTLKKRIASPGGTTEQALKVFEQANLRKICQDALFAALTRAQELGKS